MSTRGGISTFVRNMRETPLWRNWNIRHIATHRNGSALARVATFLSGLVRFAIELVLQRPDVVHIHMSSHGSFLRKSVLAWLSIGVRLPVVLHVHGSRFDLFFHSSPRLLRLLIRVTLEHVDAVVALGSAWAAELERIAPQANIIVVPNAVRPNVAVNQLVSGPLHVVFLGEIGTRKGTFALLEAWAKVVERTDGTAARLTIAGDGEIDRANAYVSRLGIGASVDVHGWLSETDVSSLLATAHVLVLPSLSEGQPMAVLEGMARGLCVIATRVGGLPEMLSDNCGVLIAPDDPEEIADAIVRVLTDADARAQFGARALQRVENEFNIDETWRRLEQLYQRVTTRRAAL